MKEVEHPGSLVLVDLAEATLKRRRDLPTSSSTIASHKLWYSRYLDVPLLQIRIDTMR